MTRGGAAASEPFDLSEVSRSGDLLDGLAARRIPDPAADDPAVRLLAALVADVDAGAPPLPSPPPRVACTAGKPGRPVVRAFVTFGAATLMLTTAGAAVAGAGADHGKKADGPVVHKLDITERSTTGDFGIRPFPADRRTAPAGEADPDEPPAASTHTRRRDRTSGRRPAAGSAGSAPASPRPPVEYGPIAGGSYGPAPLPSPSPSAPSSPPVASDPPPSPPADPPADPSAPPGSEQAGRAVVHGTAWRSAGAPAGAARDGAEDGARAGAAKGGSGGGRNAG